MCQLCGFVIRDSELVTVYIFDLISKKWCCVLQRIFQQCLAVGCFTAFCSYREFFVRFGITTIGSHLECVGGTQVMYLGWKFKKISGKTIIIVYWDPAFPHIEVKELKRDFLWLHVGNRRQALLYLWIFRVLECNSSDRIHFCYDIAT